MLSDTEQTQPILFENIDGLKKEKIGGLDVYLIEFDGEGPSPEILEKLKRVISDKRVAVELGPSNQLDSMLFAANKADADVVIGIDPEFDLTKIQPPESQTIRRPTILLFKGDGWGDRRMRDFFNTSSDSRNDRLACYSQLVAPDTLATEKMMNAAVPLSRGDLMIVLDSGAVHYLSEDRLPQGAKRTILEEIGITDPTNLDWIKHWLRDVNQTPITKEEYQQGVDNGKYPPSRFLRAGNMIVFESLNNERELIL